MKTFWAATAAGWVITGVAIVGVFRESERTHPADFGRWFISAALGHDLLLAPVVLLLGVALARLLPHAVRPVVTSGLCVAVVLSLYAIPFLIGDGRRPTNPSALPNNYWSGLGLVVGAIAIVTMVAVGLRRRARGPQPQRSGR